MIVAVSLGLRCRMSTINAGKRRCLCCFGLLRGPSASAQSTGKARWNALPNLNGQTNFFGLHTHGRAFRKHFATKLTSVGNSLENVSKWIGHKPVSTTFIHCWKYDETNIVGTLDVP